MITVTGGQGTITIQFTQEVPNGTYQVSVSGGPTQVNSFSVTLNNDGSGTSTISGLQAGSYKVTITRGKLMEVFNVTVLGATQPPG